MFRNGFLSARTLHLLLSLFCGAGGLDLGFERAGFRIGLAFDKKADSVQSYNHNRHGVALARTADVREITLDVLDRLHGAEFRPTGVIGGPPCQSFSVANASVKDSDPRHELPLVYADLLGALNTRSPVDFFVMENVPGLCQKRHAERLAAIKERLTAAGFTVFQTLLNAVHYSTPQYRERLFLIGFNTERMGTLDWKPPVALTIAQSLTVRSTIGHLPEPAFFERGADAATFPEHRNHWCMQPKSEKFTRAGALTLGAHQSRSFKTLDWDKPSRTVAYGNREVHIHPSCHRRLSVYEAMLLQGFPQDYELLGNLSSQIAQVSEAVPPPLAHAVACSVRAHLARERAI